MTHFVIDVFNTIRELLQKCLNTLSIALKLKKPL